MTNEVVLQGRISRPPEPKVLPSGDTVWVVRVVVPRADGRAGADWFDCALWSGRLRRSARGWATDDVVRVEGVLRRRFYRTAAGPRSVVEVEATGARLVRRLTRPARRA
ncbi:single-stranded DNA-binding protein [Nocardioides donggukensis]|uniref:single-stranded DNA-binding protein n=1 Tax=Nocardioides donggukensis TaxID=2774019 RepID=UPI00191D4BF8|nr:single-stranded DNA-binding protein [Nocardioides donggukensis]